MVCSVWLFGCSSMYVAPNIHLLLFNSMTLKYFFRLFSFIRNCIASLASLGFQLSSAGILKKVEAFILYFNCSSVTQRSFNKLYTNIFFHTTIAAATTSHSPTSGLCTNVFVTMFILFHHSLQCTICTAH